MSVEMSNPFALDLSRFPPPHPVRTWSAYSTYRLSPEVVPLPDGEGYRLFTTRKGSCGQGFDRPLAPEETNLAGCPCPADFQPGILSPVRFLRMEWDIYAPDEQDSASTRASADAPMGTRPAGLLLYGSLRLEQTSGWAVRYGPWPLTTGLPYGALQDDLLLRGGVDLNLSGYQFTPHAGFAVELHIKPGYRPAREVHVRVHLHMEGS